MNGGARLFAMHGTDSLRSLSVWTALGCTERPF